MPIPAARLVLLGIQPFGGSTFNAVGVISTIAALSAQSLAGLSTGYVVNVRGYATNNDGGGGLFYLDLASAAATDGGTVLATSGAGRWLRLVPPGPVNVKWFGARANGATDDTTAIQAAVAYAAGAEVYFPAGSYRITSMIEWQTNSTAGVGFKIMGDGIGKTIILSEVANNPAISANGNGSSGKYQFGAHIRDLTIQKNAAPALAIGLQIKACWHSVFERIEIKGFSSHGLYLPSALGDLDASAHLVIRECRITGNTGNGIYINDTGASFGVSLARIENNYIASNTGNGIKAAGLIVTIERNSIYQNGAEGIYVYPASSASQRIEINLNEFDGNTTQHVRLENILGGSFNGNFLTFQDNGGGYGPTKGILVGSTNGVSDFDLNGNRLRSNPTNPTSATTAFSLGANCSRVNLAKTVYQAFSGGNATPFTDAGTNTRIDDLGGLVLQTATLRAVDVSATPHAPNMLAGLIQRLRVTIAAVTINPPTPSSPPDGREMVMTIINASGGALAVTFDAVYLTSGYTNPAAGARTTARFYYDATSGAWIQIGKWS